MESGREEEWMSGDNGDKVNIKKNINNYIFTMHKVQFIDYLNYKMGAKPCDCRVCWRIVPGTCSMGFQ